MSIKPENLLELAGEQASRIADFRLRRSVSVIDLKKQLHDARLLFKTCGS